MVPTFPHSARLVMGVTVVVTSVWAVVLLDRVPKWHPDLRLAILVTGCAAGALLVFASYIGHALPARVSRASVLGAAAVAVLAAPAPTRCRR